MEANTIQNSGSANEIVKLLIERDDVYDKKKIKYIL